MRPKHKQGQLLSVLGRCNLLESELTVPGREIIFTRAEIKELSMLDNLSQTRRSADLRYVDDFIWLCFNAFHLSN